jgi:hypothetical protein
LHTARLWTEKRQRRTDVETGRRRRRRGSGRKTGTSVVEKDGERKETHSERWLGLARLFSTLLFHEQIQQKEKERAR